MNKVGYFKFHRSFYELPTWKESTVEQKVIFVTLLGMANFKECEWNYNGKKYIVKAGQFVTSIPSIIKACGKGITEQNVRTALKRFEKLGFITDEQLTRNKNRLITIKNWSEYQGGNAENLTDTLTGNLTDTLTEKENATSLENKGFVGSRKSNLTDTVTDNLTDMLNPIEEIKEIKKNIYCRTSSTVRFLLLK